MHTIVTHPGRAHKDEWIACSLLLSTRSARIERRDPTPDELEDPLVAVVDIGHQHEPVRANFDHHQFPLERPPTCSASLVLSYLGLYEDARQFCEWVECLEWFDARGAVKTAEHFGVDYDVLRKLHSPLDAFLLDQFSRVETLREGEALWGLMREFGTGLINYIRSMRERMQYLKTVAQIWFLSPEDQSFPILFLERTEALSDDPSMGVGHFMEASGYPWVGLVYPDRRGSGYAMSRFNDHPALDFRRLEGCGDVSFVHARGFLAKTPLQDPKQLLDLLRRAWLQHC